MQKCIRARKVRKNGIQRGVGATRHRDDRWIDMTLRVIIEAIKPIYGEFSRDEGLNRCSGGYTQNSNESFNATVWNWAPKSYSGGKKVLNIATDIAVCNFNDGLSNIL